MLNQYFFISEIYALYVHSMYMCVHTHVHTHINTIVQYHCTQIMLHLSYLG